MLPSTKDVTASPPLLGAARKPSGDTSRGEETAVPGLDNAALDDELPVGVVLLLLLLLWSAGGRTPGAGTPPAPARLGFKRPPPPPPPPPVVPPLVAGDFATEANAASVTFAIGVVGRLFFVRSEGDIPIALSPPPADAAAAEPGLEVDEGTNAFLLRLAAATADVGGGVCADATVADAVAFFVPLRAAAEAVVARCWGGDGAGPLPELSAAEGRGS